MRLQRKLHLWIGLLTSVILLVEAVTGLLLSEPWLMGASGPEQGRRAPIMGSPDPAKQTDGTNPANQVVPQTGERPQRSFEAGGRAPNSLMGIVRGLHEGRVGSMDLRILVDVTAVGMIVLTVTGITMSLRILRASNKGSMDDKDLAS